MFDHLKENILQIFLSKHHKNYHSIKPLLLEKEKFPQLRAPGTQGDPLAMVMYALAVVPLIRQLRTVVPDAKQVWFADDATAVGSLSSIDL